VRTMPKASECPSSSHTCDVSKLPAGTEYRIDVAGPSAFALHVINARAGGAAPAGTLLAGEGYRGVLVDQGSRSVAVITNDSADAPVAGPLVYRVAKGQSVIHVVVDAPVDADGKSDVTSSVDGDNCKVEVKPHADPSPGIDGRPLVLSIGSDCSAHDDGTRLPADPGDVGGSGGSSPGGGGQTSPGGVAGGYAMGTSAGFGGTSSAAGSSSNPTRPAESSAGCSIGRPRPDRGLAEGAGLSALCLALLGLNARRKRAAAPASRR
jgi:hypothetical protein